MFHSNILLIIYSCLSHLIFRAATASTIKNLRAKERLHIPGSPRVFISRSGEPGNEATSLVRHSALVSFPDSIRDYYGSRSEICLVSFRFRLHGNAAILTLWVVNTLTLCSCCCSVRPTALVWPLRAPLGTAPWLPPATGCCRGSGMRSVSRHTRIG